MHRCMGTHVLQDSLFTPLDVVARHTGLRHRPAPQAPQARQARQLMSALPNGADALTGRATISEWVGPGGLEQADPTAHKRPGAQLIRAGPFARIEKSASEPSLSLSRNGHHRDPHCHRQTDSAHHQRR